MKPLEGMTILDLTRLLPGPFCAWLLRNWGARVVKVEDPDAGDYLREVEPVWFAHLNAGAESIVLDLKRPTGRDAFLRLAAQADLVLEGFRPGVMERLGLGYDRLQAANPRLVLVSVGGYSPDGPYAGRAGHDLNYLARSGLLSLMGEMPPVQLADLTGGLMAAAGALAAVLGARATGRGAHVEAALQDALFALGSLQAAEARAGHEPVRAKMPLAGALPCYHLYDTKDGGRVALGALEAKFWRQFCLAVNQPDWVSRHFDPALKGELAELFRSQTLSEWAALAEQKGDICLEPVLSVTEAIRGRPSFQPLRFNGRRPDVAGPAPGRGSHTAEFLRQAGFSEQEIVALAAEA